MPRTCTVCNHPKRAHIERALVKGEPLRHIAARFKTSASAIVRHKPHVSETIERAEEAQDIAHGEDILAQVRELHARTLEILAKAERKRDLRTALAAIREARGNVTLLATMVGELKPPAENPDLDAQITEELKRFNERKAQENVNEHRAAIASTLDKPRAAIDAAEEDPNGHTAH